MLSFIHRSMAAAKSEAAFKIICDGEVESTTGTASALAGAVIAAGVGWAKGGATLTDFSVASSSRLA